MLDGVFAFILIDYRLSNTESKIYVARDPYGVRPLYFLRPSIIYNQNDRIDPDRYAFASELKMLTNISTALNNENQKKYNSETFRKFHKNYILKNYNVYQFLPGTYMGFELSTKVCSYWEPTLVGVKYHKLGLSPTMFIDNSTLNMENIYRNINTLLTNAVEKRCCTTERPIACLLSGGLDSSLITALVNDYHVKYGLPRIETYSIGLEGSVDLEHARIVADYLGTKHTEIILTEQDFLDAIPQVIYSIESFDTTTVRASIGNWFLGKYISEIVTPR